MSRIQRLAVILTILAFAGGFFTARAVMGDEINGVEVSETEAGMLTHLNAFRKRVGIAPLVITENLMQRARGHAGWMARNSSMTHSSGIQENIAMGQRSTSEVTNVWINSSGHNANMRTGAKEAGVACAVASNGTRFWCQQFATGSDRWGEAQIANTARAAENTVRAGVNLVRRGLFGRRRG